MRARLRLEHLEDRTTPSTAYDPGRVLVTFADANADHLAALQLSPMAAGVSSLGFGVYRLDLAAGSVDTAAPVLARLPGVVAATPDYRVTIDQTPNDPGFSGQWAYQNTGQWGGRAGADISAPAAWNVSTGTGQTIVAVIDTGVDYTHPDLAANMWRNPGEIPGNGIDDDGDGIADDVYGVDFTNNTGNPTDGVGHGTHVAGVIGAAGNNGVGVTGVDWHVRIMDLKFMGASGGYTSDAVRAMDYAIRHGAKVINESWGGGSPDPALAAAIGRAQAAGVIVVAAAGNQGANLDAGPFYPASYATQFGNVVTVAATDDSDRLASFSNFGAHAVTLAAPGTNIASTLPGGRYGQKSGTSMATPFVSGALALLWDTHPTWGYQQVIAKLKQSVDPLASLAGKTITGGRLDLAKLLDASPPASPPTSPPVSPPVSPPTSTPTTAQVIESVFGGPRAGVYDRVWVKFNQSIDPASLRPATVSGPTGTVNVSAVLPVAGKNNTEFLLMFSRPQTTPGTYAVTFAGNRFTASGTLGGAAKPPVSPPAPPPVSPPAAPTPQQKTYTAAGMPRPIQDLRTTRIDFAVNDSFTIADLNVTLNITHGRTNDLGIRVVAPDGRSVTLFNRRGGTGANLTNTTFDDQAATSVANAKAPFSGSVRPEGQLSLFNGLSARGVWSVQVFDLATGVSGSVNGVTLSFTPRTTG